MELPTTRTHSWYRWSRTHYSPGPPLLTEQHTVTWVSLEAEVDAPQKTQLLSLLREK